MKPILCLAAAMTCLAAAPAFAQQERQSAQIDPAELNRDTVTVALGAAVAPRYEGSKDYRVVPGAIVRGRVSGINFSTEGLRLYADVIPDKGAGPGWDLMLGPVAGLNLTRTGNPGDRRVDALGRRKAALEVGGYAGIGRTGVITSDYDRLSFSVTYVTDVTGIHNSDLISPEINYSTPLSRSAYVGLSLSAERVGQGYADTYFSVTPAGAAASGLPAYRVRKGWKSWSLAGFAAKSLTGDLTHGLAVVAGGGYKRMLNDFAETPIVSVAGSRNQWFGALGLAYTF